jgi:acetyl esterase/lipase
MSLQLRLLTAYLRVIEKPWLRRVTEIAKLRRGFERSARLGFRDPAFALYLPDRLNGVAAEWAQVRPGRPGVILYLHGGAYLMGSPATHRAMLARLSQMTGLRACLPDYRLAPEHPYPAALEDAMACWRGLVDRGYAPDRIVLGGDSAGGGLMLALLARLLARGERPAAAFALSPWTDLTLSGESLRENARRDPLLPVTRVTEARGMYLGGTPPEDPGASPLFAAFPGPPPVFLQAARTEILRDDTLRMAEALRTQGGAVTVDLWPDAPHVWPIFQGWLPEADAALRRVAAFIAAELRALPAGGS